MDYLNSYYVEFGCILHATNPYSVNVMMMVRQRRIFFSMPRALMGLRTVGRGVSCAHILIYEIPTSIFCPTGLRGTWPSSAKRSPWRLKHYLPRMRVSPSVSFWSGI